jgi:hypothetical protein
MMSGIVVARRDKELWHLTQTEGCIVANASLGMMGGDPAEAKK